MYYIYIYIILRIIWTRHTSYVCISPPQLLSFPEPTVRGGKWLGARLPLRVFRAMAAASRNASRKGIVWASLPRRKKRIKTKQSKGKKPLLVLCTLLYVYRALDFHRGDGCTYRTARLESMMYNILFTGLKLFIMSTRSQNCWLFCRWNGMMGVGSSACIL